MRWQRWALKIVRLGTHTSGLLFVNVQIVRAMPGGLRKTSPLTMVVDTASERSYICKYHQTSYLEKVFGGLQFHEKIDAQTMVGALSYSVCRGYSLHFNGIDGTQCEAQAEQGELCFADEKLKPTMRDDQDSTGKMNAPTSEQRVINFSILGRDILSSMTLLVPKGKIGGLLIFQELDHSFDWEKVMRAFTQRVLPLPVTAPSIRPDAFDWEKELRRH